MRVASTPRHPIRTFCLCAAATVAALPAGPHVQGSNLTDTFERCVGRALDLDERLAACDEVIRSDDLYKPDLLVAQRERGLVYMQMGNYGAALRSLWYATSWNSRDEEAWIALVQAHVALGELEAARRAYHHVQELFPDSAEALRPCIETLEQRRDGTLTDAELDRACGPIALRSDATFAYKVKERGYDEAHERDVASSSELRPVVFGNEVLDLLAAMKVSREAGDWSGATDFYIRALEADPVAVLCDWTRFGRGMAGHILRQYDIVTRPEIYQGAAVQRSMSVLEAVLDKNPQDVDALRERALLFAAVDAVAAASRDFDAALAADPDSSELMVLSVMAHFNVLESPEYLYGRLPDARSYYKPHAWRTTIEHAVAERRDDFLAYVAYSDVLFQLAFTEDPDLIDRAYEAMDRAIDLLPTWPEGLSKLALAYDLYMLRADAFAGDLEARMQAMDLAFRPPGVTTDIFGPPCYEQ